MQSDDPLEPFVVESDYAPVETVEFTARIIATLGCVKHPEMRVFLFRETAQVDRHRLVWTDVQCPKCAPVDGLSYTIEATLYERSDGSNKIRVQSAQGRVVQAASARSSPADAITPALKPEEWAALSASRSDGYNFYNFSIQTYRSGKPWLIVGDDGMCTDYPPVFHALAALALHQQPFGFTRADVEELTHAIHAVEDQKGFAPHVAALESLRDRIAALLPPEGEDKKHG